MSEIALWVEKLNGMTTEDIRALMREEGIRAYIGASANCALAMFLRGKGQPSGLNVNGSRIAWREMAPLSLVDYLKTDMTTCTELPSRLQYREIPVSASVNNFIARFDRGCYPELVHQDSPNPFMAYGFAAGGTVSVTMSGISIGGGGSSSMSASYPMYATVA